jgi:hypothetical protein
MPRFHNINGVRVQFTPEEEIARDEEERVSAIEKVAQQERRAILNALTAKLADDSITFTEMKELMRLKG